MMMPKKPGNLPMKTRESGGSSSCSSNIRWDHLKPFPSGIAANKMWEEWNRYTEKFEIAVSLSGVNDAVKRTQLLFLSVGDEMQGIIKAAKLRPSLLSSNCYATFISNIQSYLRSMTDTAAEHGAFLRMKQESGESAVAFHARLMCKVRSCNYSPDDEDRFVRAQLLTGLRNRELVKQARTYAYSTQVIVQSATRDEAFESENRQREDPGVNAVRSGRSRSSFERSDRRRPSGVGRANGPPTKYQRYEEINRRNQRERGSRCTRCFLFHHRNGQCPAMSRNCNKCGKRGHYAAACRQKQLNSMQDRQRLSDRSNTPDDDEQDNKQV